MMMKLLLLVSMIGLFLGPTVVPEVSSADCNRVVVAWEYVPPRIRSAWLYVKRDKMIRVFPAREVVQIDQILRYEFEYPGMIGDKLVAVSVVDNYPLATTSYFETRKEYCYGALLPAVFGGY
jgi:hypothetical protein